MVRPAEGVREPFDVVWDDAAVVLGDRFGGVIESESGFVVFVVGDAPRSSDFGGHDVEVRSVRRSYSELQEARDRLLDRLGGDPDALGFRVLRLGLDIEGNGLALEVNPDVIDRSVVTLAVRAAVLDDEIPLDITLGDDRAR